MILICDASPLIFLATLNQLELLRHLYGSVIVPREVYDEITGMNEDLPGKQFVQNATWLEIQELSDSNLHTALQLELDSGESAAIVLSIELNADLLLMDERKGRRVAQRMGKSVVGTLGILLEAKSKGLVSTIRPLLDSLVQDCGFRISPALYKKVLDAADENE